MKHLRRGGLWALLLGGGLIGLSAPARAEGPCYMAFVHGSGSNYHDDDPQASPGMDQLLEPRRRQRPLLHLPVRAALGRRRLCRSGGSATTAIRPGGTPAPPAGWPPRCTTSSTSTTFPTAQLVIVGHSMGGVVARYVVNNGMPQAPYYNEYTWLDPRMDYDLVRRKTAHVITLQAPHTGTPGGRLALRRRRPRAVQHAAATSPASSTSKTRPPATSVMTRALHGGGGGPGRRDGRREPPDHHLHRRRAVHRRRVGHEHGRRRRPQPGLGHALLQARARPTPGARPASGTSGTSRRSPATGWSSGRAATASGCARGTTAGPMAAR